MRRYALLTLLILSLSSASGCLGADDTSGEELEKPVEVPQWAIGEWWLYTFSTPDFTDDTARLVVSEDDAESGSAYMLAISSQREARRHAVLNHNPFLGRITHDNLSAYENGVPQPVFEFPLVIGKMWNFSLFGADWNATVMHIEELQNHDITTRMVHMIASGPQGAQLDYSWDERAQFLDSFTWKDSEGVVQLEMRLADHGFNHTGEVFFMRGTDMFSRTYTSDGAAPETEFRDTWLDSGHPRGDDFDHLVYWIDVDVGSSATSKGSLTLRDHTSGSPLVRGWGSGASEHGQMGVIPSTSGEYTLTVMLTGQADLRFIIAGGIEQSWTL
jgi:hypothetical protein